MYLGIDIGTSGVKAVLVSEAGAIVATAARELALSHPAPLWSEQDPDAWSMRRSAPSTISPPRHPREVAQVRGIGLSGQMHGATLLDADGRPLRPAILWNDGRSHAECAELERRCPSLAHDHRQHRDARLHRAEAALGRAARAGDLRAASPRCCCRRTMCGSRLTGEHGRGHVGRRRHALARCRQRALVGRRCSLRPGSTATTCRASSKAREVTGSARAGARRGAGAWRATSWSPAAPATMPRAPAASARSRRAMPSCRSAPPACCLRVNDRLLRRHRSAPCMPSAMRCPDTWHQMGVILSAAGSLDWLARRDRQTPAADARRRARRARRRRRARVNFLPYLSGERTPHNDAAARGAFVGLAPRTDRADAGAGGAGRRRLRLRDSLEALSAAGDQRRARRSSSAAARARATGCRSIADVLGIPVDRAGRGRFRRGASAPRGSAWLAADRRRSGRKSARRPQRLATLRAASVASLRPIDDAYRSATARSIPRSRSACSECTSQTSSATSEPVALSRGPDSGNPLAFRCYDKDRSRARQAAWRTICASPSATGTPSPGRAAIRSAAQTFLRPWFGDDAMEQAKRKADVAFEMFRAARRAVLHLPRRDVAPEGATLRRDRTATLDEIADIFAQKMAAAEGQAALGHGQPVLQPPLHGGRRDQSRSGRLRLCRGAGEDRARRHPRAGRRRTTCCGAGARATRRCSTPT